MKSSKKTITNKDLSKNLVILEKEKLEEKKESNDTLITKPFVRNSRNDNSRFLPQIGAKPHFKSFDDRGSNKNVYSMSQYELCKLNVVLR